MNMKADLLLKLCSRFLKSFKRGCFVHSFCCLLAACFFICHESFAADVQLDGVIQDLIYDADGTLSQSFTNSFHLVLFNDKWECKSTFGDYAEDLAFDGTNTYTQHYFPPPKAGSDPQANTAVITAAEIRRGSSCVDGLPPTRILWVAYCGKEFFKSNNSSPIISPWGNPSLLGADSMTYSAEWLDSQYMIPGTLKFTMSYDLWKKELKTKDRDADEPNPFKDGELMGEYSALSSTNIDGVTFPAEFELVRYAITRWHKAVVLEKFQGKVLAIRELRSAWELPPLHMKAGVQDFRFSTAIQPWLHVSYNTPQAQWLGTNDPLVTKGLNAAITNYASFEKKLFKSNKPVTNPTKRGIASLGMLVVLCLPPLAYFLVLATKKANSKIKTNNPTKK